MAVKVYVRQKGDRADLLLYYVDPLTRREVSRTAGTSDRRQAERAAALWEQELLIYRGAHNDGWEYFRDRFRDEHLETLSQSARYAYGTALNHYRRLMSPVRVSEIDVAAISVFQSKLLAEGRPLSSVGNYLTHLRSALNWAESMGMLTKAPKIKLPRQPKRVFMRGRPITEAEYMRMLAACDELYGDGAESWKRLLHLLWYSGLRLSEALRLSWSSPPILADLAAKPYPRLVFFAEGHKARRDEMVPMTPDLAAWLAKTPATARIGPVAAVPLATVPRVSDEITRIGERANVIVNDDGKFASAHDFRRAFGTRWAAKIMPMTLRQLMRHADIATTLKYYVGLTTVDAGRELWGTAAGTVAGAANFDPTSEQRVPKNVPKKRSRAKKAG